jgi:hypothetical protein
MDAKRLHALRNKLYDETDWTAAQKVERKLVAQ